MVSLGRDERVARGRIGLCLGLLGCVVLPLWAASAAAQTVTGAARVTTVVDACVPIEIELFHRLLAIELGTSIQYSPGAAAAPGAAAVHVSCSLAGIELQLSDSVTRKAMSRAVELPQVEVAARTRMLALTVAEFVVASWVELQLDQPPIEPVGARAPDAVTKQASQAVTRRMPVARRAAAESESVSFYVGASAEPVWFSSATGLMPQLSLQAELRPIAALAIGVAFSVATGEWDIRWPAALGAAQLTSTSARLSLAYVAALGPLELLAGGGARMGIVHMAGKTGRLDLLSQELYLPWGGVVAQLSAAVRVDALRLGLELEAGYVTLPMEATLDNGPVLVKLAGLFGSLGLRLGWVF